MDDSFPNQLSMHKLYWTFLRFFVKLSIFYPEIKKKQLTTLKHIWSISEEQETLILEIKWLDSWSRELNKQESLAERERQKLEEEKTKVIHCLCSMHIHLCRLN